MMRLDNQEPLRYFIGKNINEKNTPDAFMNQGISNMLRAPRFHRGSSFEDRDSPYRERSVSNNDQGLSEDNKLKTFSN